MVILIVAELIYMLRGFMYRNPVFAAVYIWVLVAIRDNQYAYDNIQ